MRTMTRNGAGQPLLGGASQRRPPETPEQRRKRLTGYLAQAIEDNRAHGQRIRAREA